MEKLSHAYLLHSVSAQDILQKGILPLFHERGIKHLTLLPISRAEELSFAEETDNIIFTYLSDAELLQLLPFALKHNLALAPLPHPSMKHARQGFGISAKIEQALDHILSQKKPAMMDLLRCNGQPVLNSVMIGQSFSFFMDISHEEQHSFYNRFKKFLTQIKGIYRLTLQPFRLETQKNKSLHTAALGIIAVEHGRSNVLSRRLLADSSAQDGMLHALILAPRSLTSLFYYLFSCLISQKTQNLPEFIGHIKTNQLIIHSDKEIDYVLDGATLCARDIELFVTQKCLKIYPGNFLSLEDAGESHKENFKTRMLPVGEAVKELCGAHLPWFNHSATEEFKDLFLQLREGAKSSHSYLTLMVLSTLLATLGLYADSTPVVIGAMILAPLMAPIIALSMGMLRQDRKLLNESAASIIRGLFVGLGFSLLLSLIIPLNNLNTEISSRISPNLLDLGVAIISGIAGAYAHARAEVAKSLAGVAIAVALVPPLSVAGIGLAWLNLSVFAGASLLLFTNLAGITLASAATFMALGYSPFHLARKGLVTTFCIVITISIPLAWSFNQLVTEGSVSKRFSGMQIGDITIRNINILQHSPMIVSAELVSIGTIKMKDIDNIKAELEKNLHQPIRFRATIIYER